MRKLAHAVLMLAIMAATVAPAAAGSDIAPIAVPELNPTSLAAGFGLLAGAVLLVRARFQK